MNILVLLLISVSATFSLTWLVHYIPLCTSIFGLTFSPRLGFCRILAPLDATLTLLLVTGAWVGLSIPITGISTIIYNVLTGIGISCGVVFIKKVMMPRWEAEYKQICTDMRSIKL